MNHSATKSARARRRVTIGARWQITLPAQTARQLDLKRGEEMDLVASRKAIVLVPRKLHSRSGTRARSKSVQNQPSRIPKDQAWYYTPEWQQMMQEAFEDLKTGRMAGPFKSVAEFKQAVAARHTQRS